MRFEEMDLHRSLD